MGDRARAPPAAADGADRALIPVGEVSRDSMGVRLCIEARPGSARASIDWDPWRSAWVVAVPEKAERGRANAAILAELARRLEVDDRSVRWLRAGKGSRKLAEVDGLSETEIRARLTPAATRR